MSVKINGLDEVIETFEMLELKDNEVKWILIETCGDLTLKLKEYIKNNVYRQGQTLKGVKGRLTTYQGDRSYKISITNKDILYIDYGSRKNSKYINFFEDFIDDHTDELVKDIEEAIIDNLTKKGV